MELQFSQRLCLFHRWGSEPGWGSRSLKDEAPSLPDLRAQSRKLSVEEKGLGTVCKARWVLRLCPDQSPEGLGAQDGHEGPNSVTFIQSIISFLLPMSEITTASLGWARPPIPELKALHPEANGRQRPGLHSPWGPRVRFASPCPLPKMSEQMLCCLIQGRRSTLACPCDPPLPSRSLRCGAAPLRGQFCQCNCLCFTSWSHSYAVPSF